MLLDLRSLLEAAAFSGVGATSQASQTETAQGLLRFIGQGAGSQAAQSESATGLERFVGSSVTAQASQSEAGTGSLRFIASAITAQASQSTAGTGQTFTGFSGVGVTTQAAQVTAGEGSTPIENIPAVGTGLPRRKRYQPIQIVLTRPPDVVTPTLLHITAHTAQRAQFMAASGETRENEDWLLLAA